MFTCYNVSGICMGGSYTPYTYEYNFWYVDKRGTKRFKAIKENKLKSFLKNKSYAILTNP